MTPTCLNGGGWSIDADVLELRLKRALARARHTPANNSKAVVRFIHTVGSNPTLSAIYPQ
jgi:hypothetical protein